MWSMENVPRWAALTTWVVVKLVNLAQSVEFASRRSHAMVVNHLLGAVIAMLAVPATVALVGYARAGSPWWLGAGRVRPLRRPHARRGLPVAGGVPAPGQARHPRPVPAALLRQHSGDGDLDVRAQPRPVAGHRRDFRDAAGPHGAGPPPGDRMSTWPQGGGRLAPRP